MALLPEIRSLLDQQATSGRPPLHHQSVEQARAFHVADAAALNGPPAPVAAVADRLVPGPAGELPVRIYYEDTDFSGIVYHANYLRFMERGRSNHLRLLGTHHRALFEEASAEAPGFAFVVRSMQIEFLKPARMDDVLAVVTAPEDVKGASITLSQRILRGEELLVEAHVRVAFVCDGRARPIPKALRTAMRADWDRIRR